MATTAQAVRTIIRGTASPLFFPGVVDANGNRIAYGDLNVAERVNLALALADYRDDVARIANLRIARLTSDGDILAIIEVPE